MSVDKRLGDGTNIPGSFDGPRSSRPAVRFTVPEHTRFVMCKGCTTKVAMLMLDGKRRPVEPNGEPHWTKCPGSAEAREKRALEQRLAEIKAENEKAGGS